MTYHVRNLANEERTFKLDHHVRSAWTFVGTDKPVEGIRSCYRFTVAAGKDKIAKQDVTEEKSLTRKETLESLSEERTKVLLTSTAIGEAVKDNIRKGTSMIKPSRKRKAT